MYSYKNGKNIISLLNRVKIFRQKKNYSFRLGLKIGTKHWYNIVIIRVAIEWSSYYNIDVY